MYIDIKLYYFLIGAPRSIPHLDDRIVGGIGVRIEEYPYQVSIEFYRIHICGGSIISANWILTAGHCVESSVF